MKALCKALLLIWLLCLLCVGVSGGRDELSDSSEGDVAASSSALERRDALTDSSADDPAAAPRKRKPGQRKRPKLQDPGEADQFLCKLLRSRLRERCKCCAKKIGDTCFTPFQTGRLWDTLLSTRRTFDALHKLDQDQFVPMPDPKLVLSCSLC